MASDWYQERLCTKQQRDIALWQRHVATWKWARFGPRERLD